MFQTVCLVSLRHQAMMVFCVVHLLLICLLSRLLSSHAVQVIVEELFTSQIVVVAKVFCIKYVVMAVAQQAQAIRMTRLHTYM